MAQKKLLFVLMVTLVSTSWGAELGKVSQDQIAPVTSQQPQEENTDLLKTLQVGVQEAFKAITDKWQKVKGFLRPSADGSSTLASMDDHLEQEVSLRIFVSSSMPLPALINYAKAAKNFGGRLVLRGLPHDSWQELAQLVRVMHEQLGDDMAPLEIDDTAFNKYAISQVPTIVLSEEARIVDIFNNEIRPKRFDKVSGHIAIKYALQLMAVGGDMRQEAQELLVRGQQL